jgi:sensor c-di-GMP phosphodiesterase-like protein
MGITKAVLGAVVAAGVARLLAPTETKRVMKTAGRTVRAGAKAVERKAKSMTKAAGRAKSQQTSKARAASAKPRKAAKRPKRKSH